MDQSKIEACIRFIQSEPGPPLPEDLNTSEISNQMWELGAYSSIFFSGIEEELEIANRSLNDEFAKRKTLEIEGTSQELKNQELVIASAKANVKNLRLSALSAEYRYKVVMALKESNSRGYIPPFQDSDIEKAYDLLHEYRSKLKTME